ncbi:hypothetical protein SARC_03298 [Sphaeroforma arctica JP610]|uniref:Rad51-like C-terminal domain-containing protein n=1 Tax=Sphaeroforma arctica JP610 TaxID=667725 RepID=A0A0L0G638_9EUKA|nr:hypothetical protein, variant 2 [Sphaeroforma arctica JP610]XP_014158396.1 hypothetical protein, variant 1 [Sphaeroforma arctica JP610]XP_014158397.1 hypothetical protein SARC_03298 [Sphaeroforma arctica JP610]KNC84493.1 hypothetical protein, variant 2 [Sphaeroforma arctica JP610]KNC84494.1 hypothetical protein, variant 1 [Sphaeroforma arctica JP610]KNC84495.1 hypothetical protein SARC_03298 [Sphaeroforma arctica JP610]|eukprot:XP_014158395.1 hypothetical protein, variant 2 [Sphaeroforma arctica JP610]
MTTVRIDGETGYQLFLRMKYGLSEVKLATGVPVFDALLQGKGVGAGDVVDIFGPPSCGKSQLLMEAICEFIMPKQYKEVKIDGKMGGVVLFDVDGRFSIARQVHILEIKIRQRLHGHIPITDHDCEALIRECLGRLYVTTCMTNAVALASVKDAFKTIPTYSSDDAPVKLVAVDGLCHLQWSDRLETQRGYGGDWIPRICRALKDLQNEHRLMLYVTTNAMTPQAENTGRTAFMGSDWIKSTTYRIGIKSMGDRLLCSLIGCPSVVIQFVISDSGGAIVH